MKDFKVRNTCRLCDLVCLQPSFKLTPTPPANEFVTSDEKQDEFELDINICDACGHVQLPTIVNPERLFRNYVYVSGTSQVFVDHFRNYATEMVKLFNLRPGDLVIEIGSNDGTLLKFFQEHGMRTLGIDPARDIAARATNDGVETLPEFFTSELANKIIRVHGKASLVIANNVFAHADDLYDIALGVSKVLSSIGIFVFEVSYLADVLEKTLFDTIYHEHLSYHSIGPLLSFFPRVGMRMFDAERIDTHGGSMRGYACLSSNYKIATKDIYDMLDHEKEIGLYTPGSSEKPSTAVFEKFCDKIENLGLRLRTRLSGLKSQGKSIAAFGAPAKSTTLMYHFGLGKELIDFIVDDSPLKQGLLTPGKHVPVLPSSTIYERKPDYLVILAWNFADSIIKKHAKFISDGGVFIVPIPELVECPPWGFSSTRISQK